MLQERIQSATDKGLSVVVDFLIVTKFFDGGIMLGCGGSDEMVRISW